MTTTEQVVHEWFERVWTNGEVGCIDERLAEPCTVIGLSPEPITSRARFLEFHQGINAALDKIQVTVDRIVASGDEFAGLVTVEATHRATGKEIRIQSGFAGRVENGQIQRAENVVDFLPMLMRLGSVAEQTLAASLSGPDTEQIA